MINKEPGKIAMMILTKKQNPIKPEIKMESENDSEMSAMDLLIEDFKLIVPTKASDEAIRSFLEGFKAYCSEDSMED